MEKTKLPKFTSLKFDKEELKKKLLDYERVGFPTDVNNDDILSKKALEYYELGLIEPLKDSSSDVLKADRATLEVIISDDYYKFINKERKKKINNENLNRKIENSSNNISYFRKNNDDKYDISSNKGNKLSDFMKEIEKEKYSDDNFSFLKKFMIGVVALGGILYGALTYRNYVNQQDVLNSTKNNLQIIVVDKDKKNKKYNLEENIKSRPVISKNYIVGFCDKDGKVVNLNLYAYEKKKNNKKNEINSHQKLLQEEHNRITRVNKYNNVSKNYIHHNTRYGRERVKFLNNLIKNGRFHIDNIKANERIENNKKIKTITYEAHVNGLIDEIKLLEAKYNNRFNSLASCLRGKPMKDGLYSCSDVYNCYKSKYGINNIEDIRSINGGNNRVGLENILIKNNEMIIDIPKGNSDFKIHYFCYNNLK